MEREGDGHLMTKDMARIESLKVEVTSRLQMEEISWDRSQEIDG